MDDDVYNAIMNSVLRYKGKYLIPRLSSPEFMEEFEKMEVREDDIFIISYPKSGTHWMQEIVQLILHDGQLEKLSAKHRRCIAEVADVKVPLPHLKAVAGPVFRAFKDDPSPRVITTHCPYALLPQQYHEKQPKTIYVYRNPKDSLISRYNFNVKLAAMELGRPVKPSPRLFSSFFDVLTSGNYAYGCWFDHINDYWGRKDDLNSIYVSYEDMKTDLQTIVKKVATFLCHPLEDDVIRRVVNNASLETMRLSFQKDQLRYTERGREVIDRTVFISKGEINQWQSIFTPKQNESFDKLFMEKMKGCELTKTYAGIKSTLI
ncbi:Sulfotransferase family cytosolic 1B member 1 [Holothuria leucospilota]|uniref:Sulfotransferase family cytosolic 1B member 1 n=1 Tax=Holothuria leucospilota TaxID=206669 RepID=A0A9Q0YNY7_HOLLE|nr:Sulfotransferase family cytosolic 1B member 1 [Holothuria leucospilota]